MFKIIDWVSQARAEIETLSAWTGLSVGLLLALAAIVYLDPALRKIAVRIGAAVIVGYLLLIYGLHTGLSDKQAEWDRANARAAAEIAARDADNAKAAGADAAAGNAELRAQIDADQEQINALRNADATCHPITRGQLR